MEDLFEYTPEVVQDHYKVTQLKSDTGIVYYRNLANQLYYSLHYCPFSFKTNKSNIQYRGPCTLFSHLGLIKLQYLVTIINLEEPRGP